MGRGFIGTITNTDIYGTANFAGTMSGNSNVLFHTTSQLSGHSIWNGSTGLFGGVTLANSGTFDLSATGIIQGTFSSSFVNNGLFEKTQGVGVNSVTAPFVNNGTLTVQAGSVQFNAASPITA